jgi:hypothetical protein
LSYANLIIDLGVDYSLAKHTSHNEF